MDSRTLTVAAAVMLIGIGMALSIRDLLAAPEPVATLSVGRAAQQIEPYTPIDASMIEVETLAAPDAVAAGAWRAEQLVGMMATDLVRQGDLLGAGNAEPIETYRGWEDTNKELVSFAASVDRLVAGQIRPGHLINIYGVSSGGDDAVTVLLQPNAQVVRVFGGGGLPGGPGTPTPLPMAAEVQYGDQRMKASTLLVVALTPEETVNLIDAIGARGFTPYVTIAGNRTVAAATPGTGAPGAAATATPPIDIAATLTSMIPTPLPTIADDGG